MNAQVSLRSIPRWVWVAGGLTLIAVPLLAIGIGLAMLFGLWNWGAQAVESGRERLAESVPALAAPLDALGAGTLDEAAESARVLAEQARAQLEQSRSLLETEPGRVVEALAPEAAAALDEARAGAEGLVQTLPALAQPLSEQAAEGVAALRQSLDQPLLQGGASIAAAAAALAALQLPTTDVGGSDPADVPRLPGFVRVAYRSAEAGATVAYAGPAPLREVVDFYSGELAEDGWQVELLEASPAAERLRFERAGRALELLVSADGPRRSRLQWQPAQA
jgi:hypothetical protein